MNHRYFQLSRTVFQNILQTQTFDAFSAKRWAGHAKWQNVKADKEQSAKFKSMHFNKLIKDIMVAVKESGDNPSTNTKLRNLIENARRVSMTNVTIQKAIDRGKSKTGGKAYWVACRGPLNIQVGFEVTFPQAVHFQGQCGAKLKKVGLKLEKSGQNVFQEKGVIVCKPLSNVENSFDKAFEDGVKMGANEVFEMADKTLVFECPSDRVDSLEAQLSNKGYKVESSGTEIEFHETIKLEREELEKIRTGLERIVEGYDEVLRCSHNIEMK